MSAIIHEREQDEDDIERYSKRPKLTGDANDTTVVHPNRKQSALPPSHSLLGLPVSHTEEGKPINFLETDVGISEYIGRGEAKVEGIIKQRFTDFLVFEVDQDGNVLHIKSLDCPEVSKEAALASEPPSTSGESKKDDIVVEGDQNLLEKSSAPAGALQNDTPVVENEPWPERFDTALAPYLSEDSLAKLKTMFLEGPEPPRVSDSGWGGRTATGRSEPGAEEPEPAAPVEDRNARNSGRRGGRDGRGGRKKEDTRKVFSKPIDSKEERTACHKIVKELFGGKLDTQTDTSAPSDEGSCIVIKWGNSGGRGGGGGRGGRSNNNASSRPSRGNFPPYIHFTMQKTNRDTQDALGHISRLLHVNIKELSVAGTKDKRGVTVQRVALNRRNKTVEEIWKLANGLNNKRTREEILSQRGERGIRIADLNYRKAGLELGMLKGNTFVITLRNVKVESEELLDEAMNTMKTKGFINYYGMQRFGTASVPTHSIGLALLRSEWQKAADLILQKRHGEHPDVEAARDAWLTERDLDKAINLFPRRCVAERCILESFKKQKGDTRNVMGALSTIPRNLRLMYIHAYQSYVWNAIVSERIRSYGSDSPIVGDIVYEKEDSATDAMDVDGEEDAPEEDDNQGSNSKRTRKPYKAARVRTLTEDDLDKYTIFDVIMPLPGTSVAYPGGKLGERYREFLKMDGLDPDNFVRKQREYTLNGSYRAILHLPKELSWKVLRYTDPDVSLAQADEDKLLGFDPPVVVPDGKFLAVQISLQLGTAAYATMALREVTKTDTSSHVQTSLTLAAEDQKYRSSEAVGTEVVEGDEEATLNAGYEGTI